MNQAILSILSQKKIFDPPDSPGDPKSSLHANFSTWFIVIWSNEEFVLTKILINLVQVGFTPQGGLWGSFGVLALFFNRFKKKWTIFEICGPVPICQYHWFCYFQLWRQKIIDFAFLFKIWDLAKKSHFSSYLNKKAEYANFIDSRLIHI